MKISFNQCQLIKLQDSDWAYLVDLNMNLGLSAINLIVFYNFQKLYPKHSNFFQIQIFEIYPMIENLRVV